MDKTIVLSDEEREFIVAALKAFPVKFEGTLEQFERTRPQIDALQAKIHALIDKVKAGEKPAASSQLVVEQE